MARVVRKRRMNCSEWLINYGLFEKFESFCVVYLGAAQLLKSNFPSKHQRLRFQIAGGNFPTSETFSLMKSSEIKEDFNIQQIFAKWTLCCAI